MAHLTRIYLKTSQAQKFGPVLPDCIIRRYAAYKKIMGLKLNSQSYDNDSDERKSTVSFPNCKKIHDQESKNRFGRRQEFYPKIDVNICKNVTTVAGVSLTSYSIGWSKIDLKRKSLLDFGSVVLSPNRHKKSCEPNDIFKVAKAVLRVLPEADLYIFENRKHTPDKHKISDLIEIQLLSMLTVLLNVSCYGVDGKEKVFFQNCSVIDYLYELKIKSERMSAGQKLQRMLNDSVTIDKNYGSDEVVADFEWLKLNMKLEFLNMIFSSQPLRRDASATAFFLALSFIELNKANINI